MKVTGEGLYLIYTRASEANDCDCDPWDSLDEDVQDVWNSMAELLQEEIDADD